MKPTQASKGPSRRDPLKDRLNAVSALRREPPGPELVAKLRAALADPHNLMVARAARVTGELLLGELAADLEAAFRRVMADPAKLDKGCSASKAIVEALLALEEDTPEVFRRGLLHRQPEPAFGGPVDVAVELRANCAVGLAGSRLPEVVIELVPLLVDPEESVRGAAARAIAAAARVDSEAVLRLKALIGDSEPEVVAECLGGLMRLAPERSFELVERFLDHRDPAQRKAAMLALGESRHERGVSLLLGLWPTEFDRDSRRVLLLALAASRREEALEFLLDRIAEGDLAAAVGALDALATVPRDAQLRQRTDEAIRRSRHHRDLAGRLADHG